MYNFRYWVTLPFLIMTMILALIVSVPVIIIGLVDWDDLIYQIWDAQSTLVDKVRGN